LPRYKHPLTRQDSPVALNKHSYNSAWPTSSDTANYLSKPPDQSQISLHNFTVPPIHKDHFVVDDAFIEGGLVRLSECPAHDRVRIEEWVPVIVRGLVVGDEGCAEEGIFLFGD
jgi:hypothetical protein